MSLKPLLNPLKFLVFRPGLRLHRIRFGAARGVVRQIDPAAKTQRILGLDEREIQRVFIDFSRWVEVLVDVGASDGYYELIFRKHNPAGTIHLIDGNPGFVAQQQEYFQFNFPGAHTRFVTPPDRQASGTFLLSRDLPLRGRRVLFKIDVDGWELDVLRSAEGVLGEAETRFIIETHSPGLEQDCTGFLKANGFEGALIRNAWSRCVLPELRPPHNRWISAVRR